MSGHRTLTGAGLLSEIQKRGFAEYQHGIPDESIEMLAQRYTEFTIAHPDPEPATMAAMLPDETDPEVLKDQLDVLDRSQDTQTEWHKYRTNVDQLYKPDGYTNRSFQERALLEARGLQIPHEDPKEYYHFTPGHLAKMHAVHAEFGWGLIPPEVTRLHSAFAPIHQMATRLMLNVCRDIEDLHPRIGEVITPQSLEACSPLRFLFYHETELELRGGGHYDKMLTLQLAESHRGLRIARTSDHEPLEVIRDHNTAVFFPGNGFPIAFPDTELHPTWHDIIATDQPNQGRHLPEIAIAEAACARWALIFFANSLSAANPEKRALHTR